MAHLITVAVVLMGSKLWIIDVFAPVDSIPPLIIIDV